MRGKRRRVTDILRGICIIDKDCFSKEGCHAKNVYLDTHTQIHVCPKWPFKTMESKIQTNQLRHVGHLCCCFVENIFGKRPLSPQVTLRTWNHVNE